MTSSAWRYKRWKGRAARWKAKCARVFRNVYRDVSGCARNPIPRYVPRVVPRNRVEINPAQERSRNPSRARPCLQARTFPSWKSWNRFRCATGCVWTRPGLKGGEWRGDRVTSLFERSKLLENPFARITATVLWEKFPLLFLLSQLQFTLLLVLEIIMSSKACSSNASCFWIGGKLKKKKKKNVSGRIGLLNTR